MTPPLKHGALVRIPPKATTTFEIATGGVAGFNVWRAGAMFGPGARQVGLTTYYWHDRGRTWSSDDLDRRDSTRDQFSKAAKEGRTR